MAQLAWFSELGSVHDHTELDYNSGRQAETSYSSDETAMLAIPLHCEYTLPNNPSGVFKCICV